MPSDQSETRIDRGSLFIGVAIGFGLSWLINVVLPGAAGSGVFP